MSDEKNQFAALIGRVQPLKRAPIAAEFGKPRKHKQNLRIAAQNQPPPPPLQHRHGTTINHDGINNLQLKHMREARVPLAREIDFHGYYVDDALRLLEDFLSERRNRRAEYWLIVHGKGKNSPHYDKAPLKTAILDTLYQHSAIGALVPIDDHHGESGAVIVRVRARAHHS